MIWHALATYRMNTGSATALVLMVEGSHQVYDLGQVYDAVHPTGGRPDWVASSLTTIIADFPQLMAPVGDLAQSAAALATSGTLTPVQGGLDRLMEPISAPRIFAAASNYVEHAREMGTVLATKANSNPYIFIKASTAVIGHGQSVIIPARTQKPDWEVELGAVIGKRTRRVSVSEALNVVAGYTIVNDVTARDLNKRDDFPFKFDWFQGKSYDTFAPLGPWIVPRSLIPDPQSLRLNLSVNDEMMQDGTTAEMIFTVSEQISYLSYMLTLLPGDIISTGTPTGVGAGRGIFLKPGDVMRATIENIGTLVNPVEAEQL